MIVKEEFLNKLRQFFGLNLYEVRIWTALLSRGVSTAGELSDIGNVPRSRAYDILESLEKKGFVVMKLGKPIKYIAVEPKEVVERVKKLVMEDAHDSVKKLEELKTTDVLRELDLLHRQGIEFIEPTDLSGAIRGRHNIYAHMESLIKNADKSVTIVTTGKGLIRKSEALKEMGKIAEVKSTNKINARFCIIDNKDIVFMVMSDENVHPSYDVGIWVNTPLFTTALDSMFEIGRASCRE